MHGENLPQLKWPRNAAPLVMHDCCFIGPLSIFKYYFVSQTALSFHSCSCVMSHSVGTCFPLPTKI